MKREDILRIFVALPLILLVAAGLAAAGGQGGYSALGFPVYALAVALAFVIQWLAFIPAYLLKTEKFYDLTGSITYLSVTALALFLSPSPDARAWLLAGMVAVWALRLGSFLFLRIRSAGEDRRFRDIKRSFSRFLIAWTLQGLWVAFSLAAVLAAITSQVRIELGAFALVGFLIWAFGFAIEIIADRQKSRFNAETQNKGKFIQSGLWAWSRHPNYFGEIVLWIGVLVIAAPVLRGWQWVALISPVFITLLLTRISGIPMLEARADEKWGGQQDYETYKAQTPILIPRPPAR
jgi:steroid 5-alpha reductase family enzyme